MGASATGLINRPILASIHTDAFQHNLNRVRELAPESKIWSVVKSGAYGHTFEAALNGLASTDGFALLNMQNALRLREQGWQGRILLLEGLFHENELALAEKLSCDLVVHCEMQIQWLEKYKTHKPFNIFLKMNTGMNRLGLKPEAYRTAFHRLHAAGNKMHHMTHFANADQVTGKRGDILIFNANVWHSSAPNTTQEHRRAIPITISKSFMKQLLDYPRAIGYNKIDEFDYEFQQLLGYHSRVPSSLDEWYQPENKRFYKQNQD
jgi:alanine racemase